jgi:hypothetical protein
VTLDALRVRLVEAHARFGRAVDGLTSEVLEREPVEGDWSARDMAAHLADWNEEILLAARALLGEIATPADHPIRDVEAFNEAHARLHTNVPWGEAKARLDDTVARSIELAGRFDGRLDGERIEHPWYNHGTIRDLFHGVCGHQEEHCEAIEAWRARRG